VQTTQALTLVISFFSLLVITLTYFRTKRVKPHEFESMISRRLEGKTNYDDVTMRFYTVRYLENPHDRIQALKNLFRKYPDGYVALELGFSAHDIKPPFTDSEWERLLDDLGFDGNYEFIEGDDPDHIHVDLEINTTRPEEVYAFASHLLALIADDYDPQPLYRED